MSSKPSQEHILVSLGLACLLATLCLPVHHKQRDNSRHRACGQKHFRFINTDSLSLSKMGALTVRGTTDLPDGAKLEIIAYVPGRNHLSGADICTAQDKHFSCTIYLHNPTELDPSSHQTWEVASIYYPHIGEVPSSQQPPEVDDLVGEHGENLEGPQTVCYYHDHQVSQKSDKIDNKQWWKINRFRI